jgi:hypothetical protein
MDKKNSKLNDLWSEILITEPPEEDQVLLSIQGVHVATAGNHSLLIGKKKTRKTLFIVWHVSNYTSDLSTEVAIFDTEQGKRHVYNTRSKIYQITGKYVPVFYLRGRSPKDRKEIIENVVSYWPSKLRLIVIDGIRDLLTNINDPEQATEITTWIEQLTIKHGLHIINVLHLNKSDNNARGHLGTELLNKAEITIELEKDFNSGFTIVKCESSRDKPFEDFAFTHGANELPELVSAPVRAIGLSQNQEKERLAFVFDEPIQKRAEVIEAIKRHFEVGRQKADILLARFVREGLIVKNGKDRSPTTVYKLGG